MAAQYVSADIHLKSAVPSSHLKDCVITDHNSSSHYKRVLSSQTDTTLTNKLTAAISRGSLPGILTF